MISYVWKMIFDTVPNIGIITNHHQRHDRSYEIRKMPRESTAKTKTIFAISFKVRGYHWNLLRKQWYRFLEGVPDRPCLLHYHTSAVSNGITDRMQVMRLNPVSYATTGSRPPHSDRHYPRNFLSSILRSTHNPTTPHPQHHTHNTTPTTPHPQHHTHNTTYTTPHTQHHAHNTTLITPHS